MSIDRVKPEADRNGGLATVPAIDTAAARLWVYFPMPLILIDGHDKVTWVNAAAEEILGLSRRCLLSATLDDILKTDPPLQLLIRKIRQDRHPILRQPVTLKARHGLGADRMAALSLWLAEDVVSGGIVVFFDTSYHAPASDPARLSQAARNLSSIGAMLAHEVKNPLASIRGAAQLMAREAPALQELTDLIAGETMRIASLMDQLEMESGVTDEPTIVHNIHEILDYAIRLLTSARAEQIFVERDYDPSLPPVQGRRGALIQLFLNLLKNAGEAIADAAMPDGRIVISTRYQPGKFRTSMDQPHPLPLRVRIADNGPGLPRSLTENLFEPFISSKKTGRGLGLAIAARIVTDHAGLIECGSSDIGGASFTVFLPKAEGAL